MQTININFSSSCIFTLKSTNEHIFWDKLTKINSIELELHISQYLNPSNNSNDGDRIYY